MRMGFDNYLLIVKGGDVNYELWNLCDNHLWVVKAESGDVNYELWCEL